MKKLKKIGLLVEIVRKISEILKKLIIMANLNCMGKHLENIKKKFKNKYRKVPNTMKKQRKVTSSMENDWWGGVLQNIVRAEKYRKTSKKSNELI